MIMTRTALLTFVVINLAGVCSSADGPQKKDATVTGTSRVKMLGTHSRDGRAPLEPIPVLIEEVDSNDYDDLDGATYRGNLRRDGVHDTKGVAELGGVKWKVNLGGPIISRIDANQDAACP